MADVFACSRCGTVLTAPVSKVALPVHAHHGYGHELLPPLMEPGTYAIDPEPSGPPWRPWSEIAPEEAEARGVFAPVHALSFGAPGAIVVAPGDVRGTVVIPERCDGYCTGLDGRDGPNLACARCGRPVATRIDDCSLWQAVWLVPDAVRRLPTGGPAPRTADWEALAEEYEGTPPIEPPGRWSPLWEAAVGEALAHLLAASGGAPVAVPGGLAADTFGRALDALLPPGPAARGAVLAGPGLPASGPAADIVLVPRHPRTGEAWRPPGGTGSPPAVPLAAYVWVHLAFQHERSLLPVTGRLPDGVLRDDPLPMHPWGPFRPDSGVFLATLARLPAVRRPWLRRIHDRVTSHPYTHPF
ncbi:hypothetical protein GCM10010420_14750 [Streptomyces glaucosporus]|uniref:Uncharacterized protein n=1 Tax=Streptomyces glaucosporus TaxID=284044 RepID=A0ABN3I0P5_9ACTN